MKRMAFNRTIAERVMGWTGPEHNWRLHVFPANCFDSDHNAAALVRERVRELGLNGSFLRVLDSLFSYPTLWSVVNATPEQTSRAAYLAVTGEKLEAIDE